MCVAVPEMDNITLIPYNRSQAWVKGTQKNCEGQLVINIFTVLKCILKNQNYRLKETLVNYFFLRMIKSFIRSFALLYVGYRDKKPKSLRRNQSVSTPNLIEIGAAG